MLTAATVSTLTWGTAAQAHGTIVGPPTRAYQCWSDWGADHMNTAMQQQDPMCWQAFQANTNTMWNWMSALRDGLGGNFQGSTPDGKLCSNNISSNDSLNRPGAWRTTSVGNNFSMHLYDQASHGADYFRVYVSKNSYDPTTRALGWGDLDFITQTGRYDRATDITFNVSTSGYTGRHIVFTIWQASHQDQTYMWCSDVTFGGGSTTTTRAPVTSAPVTRGPVTSAPVTTRAPVTSGAPVTGSGCSATYTKGSEWNSGFSATVNVTARSAINGWTVRWTWPNGQTITQAWSATVTSSGSAVTATNASYNGRLGAGQSTSFGFNGTWSGTNTAPTLTCTAS
ncbi:hypothetical protein GCM10009682_18100 [Luedemannella flava]|uniref:CBM2 domain-containing protein n=1 Tax=Luedemannella flava TaxID=349316 RepID=A0ABN2LQL6_9ACTN